MGEARLPAYAGYGVARPAAGNAGTRILVVEVRAPVPLTPAMAGHYRPWQCLNFFPLPQ
jgi:hypothetical protein